MGESWVKKPSIGTLILGSRGEAIVTVPLEGFQAGVDLGEKIGSPRNTRETHVLLVLGDWFRIALRGSPVFPRPAELSALAGFVRVPGMFWAGLLLLARLLLALFGRPLGLGRPLAGSLSNCPDPARHFA
jgi:hypothetical protein